MSIDLALIMPKISVELIQGNRSRVKRYPYEGSKINIRPWDKNRNSGYHPEFTHASLIKREIKLFPFLPFTISKERVMLFDGADKCIEFFEDSKSKTASIEMPKWDRKAEEELFNAQVLRESGNPKPSSMSSYLLMFLVVLCILGFLNILVGSGRLRL
jgi:hypothetical protein